MRKQYIDQEEFRIVLESWYQIFKKYPIDYSWKTKCKRMSFHPGFYIRPIEFTNECIQLSVRISYDIYYENVFFSVKDDSFYKFEEQFLNMLRNIEHTIHRNKIVYDTLTPDRVDISSHRIAELKRVNLMYSDMNRSYKEKIKNGIDVDKYLDLLQKNSEMIGKNGNKIMNIRSTLHQRKLQKEIKS